MPHTSYCIPAGPQRIVAVLPQLIIFIKNALNTRGTPSLLS
jgi:hypothetical protein